MLRVATLLTALLSALPATADQEAENAFARQFLDKLQTRSFKSGREYCGYFGYDKTGNLVATKPQQGDPASCQTRRVPRSIDVFASYHTHGIYHSKADNEVPSVLDVEGDMAAGMNGYLSTPGGRLWFIEGSSGVSWQLCGSGCLQVDPGFKAREFVPEAFTLDELKERQGE